MDQVLAMEGQGWGNRETSRRQGLGDGCEGREREKVTEGFSGGPGRPEMKARVRMGGSREGRQQGKSCRKVFSFCL